MCVALIGGMDRLKRQYINEAESLGIELRVFTKPVSGMPLKIKNSNVVVIFTNKVSHQAKKEAVDTAKANGIPFYMYHSCGISTLRDCLCYLKKIA